MHRTFIVSTVLLVRSRTHHKLARWDHDHLGTGLGAFLEWLAHPKALHLVRRKHVGPDLGDHEGPHGRIPIPPVEQIALIDPAYQAGDDYDEHRDYKCLHCTDP